MNQENRVVSLISFKLMNFNLEIILFFFFFTITFFYMG